MTPKQILAVLVARWPWAVAVLLLSITASVMVSMTMLKRYTASATVLLDARTPDQVAGGAPNALPPGGYLANQAELMTSERVSRAVIRTLNLGEDSRLRTAWQQAGNGEGDYEAWLSELLVKGLSVRQASLSNVVTVSYTSDDAAYAAQVVNAYVKAYVDASLKIRDERLKHFGGVFDARANELRTALERAQVRLSEFQQKHRLLAGDDRLDVETLRLSELSSQLLAAQTANAEVSGRLRQAGRQTDQLQEVWRNPSVAALSADVNREEVRLRELTSRLGESHPQLIEQQARLTELKEKLAAEKGRAVTSVGFDNSAAQNRVAQVSSALEAQRAKVLRIQGQREQATTLQRDVENAQRAYDAMQQRVGLATLESQNTHSNITVLKQATTPTVPSSPNLLKNIAASIAVGLLLGAGLVIGREQLDRRMRTVDDIVELKQAMLVSLPVSAHVDRAATETSRTRLMKQRVLTGLPRPAQQQTS
jgi:chain length determinant protein EpsF